MLKVGLAIRRIFVPDLDSYENSPKIRTDFRIWIAIPHQKNMLPLKQGHENPEVLITQISLQQILEEAGRCQLGIKTGYLQQWSAGVSGGSTSR